MAYRSNFGKIIREVAQELNIETEVYSNDWCYRLTKGDKVQYIVGYHFPLNLSASKELCQDKALTYSALKSAGIPAVPHLFLPNFHAGVGESREELTPQMQKWIDETGYTVVKDNYGTGGNQVYRTQSLSELDEILPTIYTKSYAACVCPFMHIIEEYRVTMLDDEPQQVIRKERQSTINENGEKVYLNWKHNLGQGATGILVEDKKELKKLYPIAIQVMKVMNLRFASVDIVKTTEGYFVLEVNAGVMMEHFAGQNEECYQKAKAIYRKAILKAMGESND